MPSDKPIRGRVHPKLWPVPRKVPHPKIIHLVAPHALTACGLDSFKWGVNAPFYETLDPDKCTCRRCLGRLIKRLRQRQKELKEAAQAAKEVRLTEDGAPA